MAKKRSKPGPKGKGDRKAFIVRMAPKLVEDFDAIAAQLNLSRVQLLERLVRDMVKFRQAAQGEAVPNLFASLEEDIERMIERALRDAMREGGIDLVLSKASQGRKALRRSKRS